jgi:hypothetical protein
LETYAVQAGLTKDELQRTTDHRVVVAFVKAMRYDALVAKKRQLTGARRPVSAARPGVGGGQRTRTTPEQKARNDARERLRQSGRPEDAASVIEGILGGTR